MVKLFVGIFTLVCLLTSTPALAQKASLKGSKASVTRMDREATRENFTRLPNGDRVEDFVDMGLLKRLTGNRDYSIIGATYPYVRPEVKTFVERLSQQSRVACSRGLTVTSATRPKDEQPRNASKKSVHPTGMAVDFRVPPEARCEAWLKKTLLALEGKKVLEATREKSPPHYHVAVFPEKYADYLASKTSPVPNRKKVVQAAKR